MERKHFIITRLLWPALAAILLLGACSVSFDFTEDDIDYRINIRDVPPQAKKIKLEVYDLRILQNAGNYVQSVERQMIGAELSDYYVMNNKSEALQPNQTWVVDTTGGKTVQPLFIMSDHLGDLFVHVVVMDANNLPYSHFCSCRKGNWRVQSGQVIDLPGKSRSENPDLYDSLCGAYGIDNCFACGDDVDLDGVPDPTVNLPCKLLNTEDGDEEDTEDDQSTDDVDNDTDADPTDTDVVQDGDQPDTEPSDDQDGTDSLEEGELPVGQYFVVSPEDHINHAKSQPDDLVTTINGVTAGFYGSIVLLGGDPSSVGGLGVGDKLVFDFDVQYPGRYHVLIQYAKATFHAEAKVLIDDLPVSDAPFDIEMYQNCSRPCDNVTWFFMKPGSPQTINSTDNPVYLENGSHTLTVEVKDKIFQSTGYGLGVDHLFFYPADTEAR